MRKVLWISKYSPIPAEIEEIDKVIGEAEHIVKSKSFTTAREVIDFINEHDPDIVVPILRMSMKKYILEHRNMLTNPDIIFLEPIMREIEDLSQFNPRTDFYIGTTPRRTILRFEKFRILKGIKIETEEFTWEKVRQYLWKS